MREKLEHNLVGELELSIVPTYMLAALLLIVTATTVTGFWTVLGCSIGAFFTFVVGVIFTIRMIRRWKRNWPR